MNNELIVLSGEEYLLDTQTANAIAALERTMKGLKEKQDEIKMRLKEEMVAKNIKSIKDEISGVTITYTAPTQKETFNAKKFRQEHSDLYDEYINFTDVKDSIRISVK